MTGSEQQSKTSQRDALVAPPKGHSTSFKDVVTGHEYRVEGMGAGRYRIHSVKRQPRKK